MIDGGSYSIAMETDHCNPSASTDHLSRRLRPKRNQQQSTSTKMPTDHSKQESKRKKPLKPPEPQVQQMMLESSDEECDDDDKIETVENTNTVQQQPAAAEVSLARAEPAAREVPVQPSDDSPSSCETQHFATLLTLADIDRKKSAHLESIRRQRQFMNGQAPALAHAQSVDADTKLLHAVLKTLSTMSGIPVSNEDMASATSVGLFTCRAMRSYALTYDRDPIKADKPDIRVHTGLDQEQQSKLKMVQNVLNTMLA